MPYGRICSHQDGAICTDCPTGRCRLDNRRRYEKRKRGGTFTAAWERLRVAALARADRFCELNLDERWHRHRDDGGICDPS